MGSPGRKIGLAVIGLGRMGALHFENLYSSRRAVVRWVVRNDLSKAKGFLEGLEAMPRCVQPKDLDQVLKDDGIDGVVICSSTLHHDSQIRASLDAGKAVFSEKPVTEKLSTTKECYDIAQQKGLPLFCGFHRRFDPSFMSVHSGVRAPDAGRLRLLRMSSHDPDISGTYIKSSGGVISDSTIHDLDMALWLSGSPVKRIYTHGHAFNPAVQAVYDHDLIAVTMEHENGTVSMVDNGRRCSYGYDQRLEALCENASFFVTNQQTDLVHSHNTSASVKPGIDQSFLTRYPAAYASEMEHFLDLIEGKATLRVTREDALQTMSLVNAAVQSLETRKPVDIS